MLFRRRSVDPESVKGRLISFDVRVSTLSRSTDTLWYRLASERLPYPLNGHILISEIWRFVPDWRQSIDPESVKGCIFYLGELAFCVGSASERLPWVGQRKHFDVAELTFRAVVWRRSVHPESVNGHIWSLKGPCPTSSIRTPSVKYLGAHS